jgi:putative endonuclease
VGIASTAAGWYVYIARCADGTLYTGITNDVARRIAAHNSGKGSKYTAARRPVTLVHLAPAADRSEASRIERRTKRLTRAQKLALIARQGM